MRASRLGWLADTDLHGTADLHGTGTTWIEQLDCSFATTAMVHAQCMAFKQAASLRTATTCRTSSR